MIERIEPLVRQAVSPLPVFCGFVPPGETFEVVTNCIIISRSDIDEATIEVRLSTCQSASRTAEKVLDALDSAGILRDVLEQFDSPNVGTDRGGVTLVVAV